MSIRPAVLSIALALLSILIPGCFEGSDVAPAVEHPVRPDAADTASAAPDTTPNTPPPEDDPPTATRLEIEPPPGPPEDALELTALPPLHWCEAEDCTGELFPAECGNGVLDIGEHCDDGLSPSASACAPDCTPRAPFARFDQNLELLREDWQLPGMSVAVTYQDRLVLVRTYGLADVESGEPVTPWSRFRLGSLSKTLTSTVVLSMVERGLLDLDAPAFAYLDAVPAPEGTLEDPRLYDITLRHLLNHTGGWDASRSGDPLFGNAAAQALGVTPPASIRQITAYMRTRPLDFAPGTHYAYNNFGYALLGLIVEEVSGTSYEAYAQEQLAPLGIDSMAIGHTRFDERLPREVRYYGYPDEPLGPSVFPDVTEDVPHPYGAFYLEGLGAAGGWIGSAIDVTRLLVAIDGNSLSPDLLSPETLDIMTARPDVPEWQHAYSWYGMGMQITPTSFGDTANWSHTGSISGTSTLFVRSKHDFTWVILVNARPENVNGFFYDLDETAWRAIRTVEEWPTYDLFNDY